MDLTTIEHGAGLGGTYRYRPADGELCASNHSREVRADVLVTVDDTDTLVPVCEQCLAASFRNP